MIVKGKTEPIQVFPVQQYSQAEVFATDLPDTAYPAPYRCSNILDAVPLFGSVPKSNISESNALHRALVVYGDSGTGKTMLINHVVQRHSLRCFRGCGDSVDTAVDFHAWRGIAKVMATIMVKASQRKVSIPTIDAAGINRDSSFTTEDPTALDPVKSSNLTVHRPSQHGRPSRASTLTTHDENNDDPEGEVDLDSSFARRIVDNGKPSVVEAASPNGLRVTALEYLVLHQQVTKETLKKLRHWFPYEDPTMTAPTESTAEKGKEC